NGSTLSDVRFGSKRNKALHFDVCFTPKADIRQVRTRCRLSANSGHAPTYSITSSARASNEAGIVMPNAFAVLRLITISYLDACSTGSSSGLAPLRILSMQEEARLCRSVR